MKIVIIGATGFVGSAVLKEALSRGHQVTAIVRHPEKLNAQNKLVATSCDIFDTDKLARVLAENELIVSAYNAGWNNPNLYEDFLKGSESIQLAAKRSGVKRLIVVGGAGSLFVTPNVQLVDTPDFPPEYKPGSLAARDYLNILKKEDQLDWTFINPAIEMNPGTSGVRTGSYKTGTDSPVFDEKHRSHISVEDLAVAIIDEAEKPKHVRKRFTVGY